MAGSTIPLVDVSALSLENEDFDLENISPAEAVHLQNLGSHLTSALRQNGFVYIAGHGLDQQLVQQVGMRLKKHEVKTSFNYLWLQGLLF